MKEKTNPKTLKTLKQPKLTPVPNDGTFYPVDGMFDVYEVEFTFKTPLVGGVPKNKDLIRVWVESRTGYTDAVAASIVASTKEAIRGSRSGICGGA
jgi:hypothetical protein